MASAHEQPSLLTVKEAALLCRTSDQTIRRWIRCERIRATRPGGKSLLIERAEIDRLLAGNQSSATEVGDWVAALVQAAPTLTPENIQALRKIIQVAGVGTNHHQLGDRTVA
jgi:excisionase family DNA binding protein